jgi:phenol hydroxylase P4 protein
MTVKTNFGEYPVGNRDAVENFHGNQLVYIAWDDHLSFCSANAYPLPPEMPFGAILEAVLPGIHGTHADFEKINWESAEWTLDGNALVPDMGASLADNGIGHKSLLRFKTPGLSGYNGTRN